jgi:hypothetical protein
LEKLIYVAPDIIVSVARDNEDRKPALELLNKAVDEGWILSTSTQTLSESIGTLSVLFPSLSGSDLKSKWFSYFREWQILLKEIHSVDLLDIERAIDFMNPLGKDSAVHVSLAIRYCRGNMLSLDSKYDKAIGITRILFK